MEKYIKNIDLQTVSMQTLAFIGDAVYNIYIRCYLASRSNAKTGFLHKQSIRFVSAKSQSRTMDAIIEKLTNEEVDIYKRGRNTNIITSKHAETIEYKKATGFEALIGYLYIDKQNERLEEIIKICIDEIDKE
ncbi:MAG: ribonuclease III domain-containing protein [Clostridia bacterium]|nr:ribonuclease III domain-containing protein [Clostridia bacterium]